MPVRTRFAPSPTGYLHVGGYRTALYAFYVARQNGGAFILRIEDTDRERLVPGAVEALVRTFARMNMTFDEGPILVDGALKEQGSHGPYVQSARVELYKKYAQQLVDDRRAYPCFCSKKEIQTRRETFEKTGIHVTDLCRSLSVETGRVRMKNESHVLRFSWSLRRDFVECKDLVHGNLRFPNTDFDDFIILKSDGFPTYHLASVVDDHLMKITHVIRGDEWLSSLPKHVMLYEAFGWQPPAFAHLPLILNPDKTKLSKRQGDVAVEDYLAKGYLPEALENFVALIGYNPTGDREIYARDEMIRLFDLTKVNASGGVFNLEKLNWMNQQYLQKKTPAELAALGRAFVDDGIVDDATLEKICAVERTRLTTLGELPQAVENFLAPPSYEAPLLVWKKADAADAKASLDALAAFLETQDGALFADAKTIETSVMSFIAARGLKNGNVLWPARVALSGRAQSPGPFEFIWVLGKDETLRRLRHAVDLL